MFRHILQHLGNIFTQLAQLSAAITLRLLRRVHLGFARQMLRQRTPCRFRSRCSNKDGRSCRLTLDGAGLLEVPSCGFRVLAARPLRVRENWASELFGDYNPGSMLIRIWMRTAVRKEITSFGTFLSTLCHEFCHHLDFQRFRFPDSWHTCGFYERTATLYHYARDTAPKRLFWAPVSGGRWRIDWPRTNRGV